MVKIQTLHRVERQTSFSGLKCENIFLPSHYIGWHDFFESFPVSSLPTPPLFMFLCLFHCFWVFIFLVKGAILPLKISWYLHCCCCSLVMCEVLVRHWSTCLTPGSYQYPKRFTDLLELPPVPRRWLCCEKRLDLQGYLPTSVPGLQRSQSPLLPHGVSTA